MYAGLKEETIKDYLVVGFADKSLSERLQIEDSMMLEKAKTAIRQHEAMQNNRPLKGDINSDPITVTVDALTGKAKQSV